MVIYQDFLRLGGTERHSIALAQAAMQAGHETTLLTNRPGGRAAREAKKAGLTPLALQAFDSFCDEWAPNREKVLARLRPDVLVCMGNVANGELGKLKAQTQKMSTRLIGTARTGKRLGQKLRKAYAAADAIICNSHALENLLLSSGIRAPMIVIGNALLANPRSDPAARMLLRRKMSAGENTTVVLCLQRMIPGKQQQKLMENFFCAAHDCDAQLWIVGHGPSYWPLKLYARILGEDKIKVLRQELPVENYYNAADMAATTSHEDSLPNFLIEAHAFGLCGVCEDYAGCGEVVVGGLTGYVCPVDDTAEYASAMRELILSPQTRRFMGETARTISFRFNREQLLKRFLRVIETVGAKNNSNA